MKKSLLLTVVFGGALAGLIACSDPEIWQPSEENISQLQGLDAVSSSQIVAISSDIGTSSADGLSSANLSSVLGVSSVGGSSTVVVSSGAVSSSRTSSAVLSSSTPGSSALVSSSSLKGSSATSSSAALSSSVALSSTTSASCSTLPTCGSAHPSITVTSDWGVLGGKQCTINNTLYTCTQSGSSAAFCGQYLANYASQPGSFSSQPCP